jgi:hypothetical protein
VKISPFVPFSKITLIYAKQHIFLSFRAHLLLSFVETVTRATIGKEFPRCPNYQAYLEQLKAESMSMQNNFRGRTRGYGTRDGTNGDFVTSGSRKLVK